MSLPACATCVTIRRAARRSADGAVRAWSDEGSIVWAAGAAYINPGCPIDGRGTETHPQEHSR